MLEEIDKKPMIRTALAICLGILLALIIALVSFYLYHRFLEDFDLILIAAVTAAIGSVLVWIYIARRHQMSPTRRRILIGTLVAAISLGGIVSLSNIAKHRTKARAVEEVQRQWQEERQHDWEHKYDDLIVEQRWILQHPDDERLNVKPLGVTFSLTPKGKELEKRLAQPLHQNETRLSGAGDYESVLADMAVQDQNKQIMQAISNVFGTSADPRVEAEKLGYKYGFDLESARFNVRRAENFIDVFETVDPILRKKYR